MTPNLLRRYEEEIVPSLMDQLKLNTRMQVPALTKVTLNMGVGDVVRQNRYDIKPLERAMADMEAIAGQKPKMTQARKSEATYKIRAGYFIGCMVTLRRARMYEFIERLIGIALPRTRDFRGLNPRSFDGRGNYALGIQEQIIFPEIDFEKIEKIRGMNICINTSAQTDSEALTLLQAFDFPFRN